MVTAAASAAAKLSRSSLPDLNRERRLPKSLSSPHAYKRTLAWHTASMADISLMVKKYTALRRGRLTDDNAACDEQAALAATECAPRPLVVVAVRVALVAVFALYRFIPNRRVREKESNHALVDRQRNLSGLCELVRPRARCQMRRRDETRRDERTRF